MSNKNEMKLKSTLYIGDSDDEQTSSMSDIISLEKVISLGNHTQPILPQMETSKISLSLSESNSSTSEAINDLLDELTNISRQPGMEEDRVPRKITKLSRFQTIEPKAGKSLQDLFSYNLHSGGNNIRQNNSNKPIQFTRLKPVDESKIEVITVKPRISPKSRFLLAEFLKPEPPIDIGYARRAERALFMQNILLSSLASTSRKISCQYATTVSQDDSNSSVYEDSF